MKKKRRIYLDVKLGSILFKKDILFLIFCLIFSIECNPKIISFERMLEFWKWSEKSSSIFSFPLRILLSLLSQRSSRSRSVDNYTDPSYASYNIMFRRWKWLRDMARRSGAAHRLIGINGDNNVWLTCNWTTLDNPIGLYTNWTIPNGSVAGRSIAATVLYIVAALFSMAGRLNSLHDSDPIGLSRNCLIRSAGQQKIRMGSSSIPIYTYTHTYIRYKLFRCWCHRKYQAAVVISEFHA